MKLSFYSAWLIRNRDGWSGRKQDMAMGSSEPGLRNIGCLSDCPNIADCAEREAYAEERKNRIFLRGGPDVRFESEDGPIYMGSGMSIEAMSLAIEAANLMRDQARVDRQRYLEGCAAGEPTEVPQADGPSEFICQSIYNGEA